MVNHILNVITWCTSVTFIHWNCDVWLLVGSVPRLVHTNGWAPCLVHYISWLVQISHSIHIWLTYIPYMIWIIYMVGSGITSVQITIVGSGTMSGTCYCLCMDSMSESSWLVVMLVITFIAYIICLTKL